MTTINTSDTGINICTNPAYQNTILLKQRFQLKNIPPQRYDNLVNNPYISNPQYTQTDFDMRRKAEILKYSASKTNTKTNNLTKAEKWRLIVNGSTKRISDSFIKSNTISQIIDPISNLESSITIQSCPSGTIITTPSYASGIPGPLTQLYLDPTVPLYNYATGQDPYAILNNTINTTEFTYDSELGQYDNLLLASPPTSILLTSIYIENPVSQSRDFTITFPISMFIKGTVRSDLLLNTKAYTSINNSNILTETRNERQYNYQKGLINQSNLPITINFSKPLSCSIKYGNDTVLNVAYDIILSNLETSVTFDISMVPNYDDPYNNMFFGNQNIGICTINNFRITDNNGNTIQQGLTTQIGNIYDIYLNTLDSIGNSLYNVNGVYSINPNDSDYLTYFDYPSYGIYANISQLKANETNNCSTRNSYTYPPSFLNKPLSII